MPWCEECAKYWTPNSMNADGTCPTCGRGGRGAPLACRASAEIDETTPWHFKLLVVTLVVYLGWRFCQILT